jgi:hypothetical protein
MYKMKTRIFWIACLLTITGITQLSAQNGNIGSGTVYSYRSILENGNIIIYSGKDPVDALLFNQLTKDYMVNMSRGESAFNSFLFINQEFTSRKTGEVFKVKGSDDFQGQKGIATTILHLSGNKGDHFSLNLTWDTKTCKIISQRGEGGC